MALLTLLLFSLLCFISFDFFLSDRDGGLGMGRCGGARGWGASGCGGIAWVSLLVTEDVASGPRLPVIPLRLRNTFVVALFLFSADPNEDRQ